MIMADFKTPVRTRGTKGKSLAETPCVIPASPFLKKLGYGSGVAVYELVRSPRTGQTRSPWAIKRIIKGKKQQNSVHGKRLLNEAKILRKLSHPNIVGFRTLTKMADGRQCLGMEACGGSLGDLIEHRMENELPSFPADNILKVALDIGKALDYIHTKVMILHGDIKSHNILVNGDFDTCKLCDFGVSLSLDENGRVIKKKGNNYIGTLLWSAPEVINDDDLMISTKADIFSFGLSLWEMLALIPPHSDHDFDHSIDESVVCLDDTLDDLQPYGTRPFIPSTVDECHYEDVFALFYCMTMSNPEQRPSANHIVLCAEDMIEKRRLGVPYVEVDNANYCN